VANAGLKVTVFSMICERPARAATKGLAALRDFWLERGTPRSFVSADSKGVAGAFFVSADSTVVISPLFSLLAGGVVSADYKGFAGEKLGA
jgi:hypothetical protein